MLFDPLARLLLALTLLVAAIVLFVPVAFLSPILLHLWPAANTRAYVAVLVARRRWLAFDRALRRRQQRAALAAAVADF